MAHKFVPGDCAACGEGFNDPWHQPRGHAKHTLTTTDYGPPYCQECTSSAGDWVAWPCPAVEVTRV